MKTGTCLEFLGFVVDERRLEIDDLVVEVAGALDEVLRVTLADVMVKGTLRHTTCTMGSGAIGPSGVRGRAPGGVRGSPGEKFCDLEGKIKHFLGCVAEIVNHTRFNTCMLFSLLFYLNTNDLYHCEACEPETYPFRG